jgi:hypothetical protein
MNDMTASVADESTVNMARHELESLLLHAKGTAQVIHESPQVGGTFTPVGAV